MDSVYRINRKYFLIVGGLFVFHIFVSVILYYIASSDFLQNYHTGKGTWNFALDSLLYHRVAVGQAELLAAGEYLTWWISPGYWHVRLMSIFYYLFIDHPLVFAPVNAVVWLTTAFMIYKTSLEILQDSGRKSLLITIIFCFWPSYFFQTTQLLKDPLYVFGVIMLLFGLTRFMRGNNSTWNVPCVLFGLLLCLWIRHYIFEIFLYATIMVVVMSMLPNKRVRVQSLLVLVMLYPLNYYYSVNFKNQVPIVKQHKMNELKFSEAVLVGSDKRGLLSVMLADEAGVKKSAENRNAFMPEKNVHKDWIYSPKEWVFIYGIPDYLEFQMKRVVERRKLTISDVLSSGSNIDLDVAFHSSMDVFSYLPRAFQIGYFAPFPSIWFNEAKTAGQMTRVLVGAEMLTFYIIFVGFVIFLFSKEIPLQIRVGLLILIVPITLLTAYVVVNMGAFHRMRYAYLTPVFIGGVYGWGLLIRHLERIKKRLSNIRLRVPLNTAK